MNKECDVILTYCWNRVGYTILKSLHQKGLKVWAVDTSKKNICSMSNLSRSVHRGGGIHPRAEGEDIGAETKGADAYSR